MQRSVLPVSKATTFLSITAIRLPATLFLCYHPSCCGFLYCFHFWPDTDMCRASNPLLSSIVMVVALIEWFVYIVDNSACCEITFILLSRVFSPTTMSHPTPPFPDDFGRWKRYWFIRFETFWHHWFNHKVLSKFGQQQLVTVNYACGFNQSETGEYFKWMIIVLNHVG